MITFGLTPRLRKKHGKDEKFAVEYFIFHVDGNEQKKALHLEGFVDDDIRKQYPREYRDFIELVDSSVKHIERAREMEVGQIYIPKKEI